MKLTAFFQIKLTKTNPAPAIIHAFNIEGQTSTDVKEEYLKGYAEMKATYRQYKHFERIAVTINVSDWLMVGGIGEEIETGEGLPIA
jgi:hypothetical protein